MLLAIAEERGGWLEQLRRDRVRMPQVIVHPPSSAWPLLLQRTPTGEIFKVSLARWRQITRQELGLSVARPIIATGHQTMLWHPGILAKYLAVDGFAAANDVATANLIVDQHADGFGEFEIPIRKADGSLAIRKFDLCRPAPRKDVPMGRHEAFTPPRPPEPANLHGAIPSVSQGVQRIFEAVYKHRNAPNAALQMAAALADLMQLGRWVRPMPNVTATDLINTSLAVAIMREMIHDPWRCAASYNRAVASVPEAGIGPLLIRDDYVELPLWRIRDDGRRMRAYDNDVEKAISNQRSAVSGDTQSKNLNPKSKIALLPRALFMTALVRLGMCDLFIHGTGGAVYDRAMGLWIDDWLGVAVGSIAVVTADLRLPLMPSDDEQLNVCDEALRARRLWHDPESVRQTTRPSSAKQRMLEAMRAQPRNSPQRKAMFLAMHEALERLRAQHSERVHAAQERAAIARRQAADRAIAEKRDWPFALYPTSMIDELGHALHGVTAAARASGAQVISTG